MSPSDLEEVVAFFHHIDSLGRFSEILLKSNRFSLGDSDPIVTSGKIKRADLWVEFLYGSEIGLRCLGDGFKGCGTFDFEIDDIMGNRVVILVFFKDKSEFLRF